MTSRRATPAPKIVATARYRRLPRANSWKASARRWPAGDTRARLAAKVPASVTVKNSSRIEERDAAEDPGHTAEQAGDDVDQLSRVEGGLDGLELSSG